jgi:uncharacterized protein with NAD-binding domain and iron-sulfur cluster
MPGIGNEASQPPEPLSVTIIGAGITGLSAAHEFMERGFEVQVIERRPHPYESGGCDIGGMARTQWSRFPGEEFRSSAQVRGMRKSRPPLGLAKATEQDTHDVKSPGVGPEADFATIPFELRCSNVGQVARGRLERLSTRLQKYILDYVARDDDGRPCAPHRTRAEILYIEGYRYSRRRSSLDDETDTTSGEPVRMSSDRAAEVREVLLRDLSDSLPETWAGHTYLDYVELRAVDLEDVLCVSGTLAPREQSIVRVRVGEVALPGEHGYRFFPGFYRHLDDVMRRIPIVERRPRDVEDLERTRAAYAFLEARAVHKELDPLRPPIVRASAEAIAAVGRSSYARDGRTVRDNLLAVELHSIAREGDAAPVELSRRRATSVREVLEIVRTFQEQLQIEAADLARYQLKLVQYMTSSTRRRQQQYEKLSWSEFIGIDAFSDSFKEALKIWPQALVGMRSDEVDARTAGNITVQLLLDQLRDSGLVDATLNASTSEAWLEPWRRYLESEGVVFTCAKLEHIRWDAEHGVSLKFGEKQPEASTYCVLALPVEEVYALAVDLHESMSGPDRERWFEGTDLSRVVEFMREQKWDPAHLQERSPQGPLRHFSGIQLFLEHDVRLVRGHIYYASSPWGLTSISQVQFRRNAPGVRDDYRGIISLDIGNWSAPGRYETRAGWDCSPSQISSEVWQQVDAGARSGSRSLAEPLWYHIDDEIKFRIQRPDQHGDKPGIARNESPYLLNLPGAWKYRPGGGNEEEVGQYSLLFDNEGPGLIRAMVLAGTFMRTNTRLVTMEAANESARHAVNRILDHAARTPKGARVGSQCRTWSPEDREPKDLEVLKDLDEKLCARGLPHLFDILQLENAISLTCSDDRVGSATRSSFGEMFEPLFQPEGVGARVRRNLRLSADVIAALETLFGRGG